FPEVYVPTVFENYVADVEVCGKQKTSQKSELRKSSISIPTCPSSWLGTRRIFEHTSQKLTEVKQKPVKLEEGKDMANTTGEKGDLRDEARGNKKPGS
ncbi:hypothetical protein FD755_016702, partial [Muntiacus reevesi]